MVEEGSATQPAGSEPAGEDGDLGEVQGREDERAEDDVGLLRDVLDYLARSIVEHPDAVEVSVGEDDRGPVLHLRVDPEDMGKIIGRGGRTARALRTLVRAAGTRSGVSAFVDIVE